MILNLYVAVMLGIALFTLAVGIYTALKAYRIGEVEKPSIEQKYELEKNFYLVSTVGWITLLSRIAAIPLFWMTVISLIPSVPGAMCEFGVFQAGFPYSWADFGVKLVTVFAFGGWLFVDYANRKIKGAPLVGSLSRGFVLLFPLLFIDAFLDIMFFGNLAPLVVPCCMVVYTPQNTGLFSILLTGCPFCLVTYEMPLLMGTIPAYVVGAALVIWSFLTKQLSSKYNALKESASLINMALKASMLLVAAGTVLLVAQIIIGPFGVY